MTRDARDHQAWGTQLICAGMHLARLEMEVLREALVEADVTLAAGTPTLGTNRDLFRFTLVPFRIDSNKAR